MGRFGWSLPPGVTRLPGEESDDICQVCWKSVDDCICPECKQCGEAGNPHCYQDHGMTLSPEQVQSAQAGEAFYSAQAADEARAEMELDKSAEEYWKKELANGAESGKFQMSKETTKKEVTKKKRTK